MEKGILSRFGVAVLIAATLVSCGKKPTPPPSSPGAPPPKQVENATPEQMRTTFGAAYLAPNDVEFFGAFYRGNQLWDDFVKSKFWASLRSNPMMAPLNKAISGQDIPQAQKQGRDKALAAARALMGREWFLYGAPGVADSLLLMQDVANEMRFARIFSKLGALGSKDKQSDPKAEQEALLAILKERGPDLIRRGIPPMVFGFRAGSDKALIEEMFGEIEKKLPPDVAKSEFKGPENASFRSWVMDGKSLLEGPKGADVRGGIKKLFGDDEKAAKDAMDTFATAKIEVARGWVGEYLLISVGKDHSHLRLAASPSDSIMALPEMARASGYANNLTVSLSYSGKAFLEKCMQGNYQIMPILTEVEHDLGGLVTPAEMSRIKEDVARLDAKGRKLAPQAQVGVAFTVYEPGKALRSETYGGYRLPSVNLNSWLELSPRVPADAVLWMAWQASPEYRAAMSAWIEDLSATFLDTAKRVALPKAPPEQAQQMLQMESLFLPKVTELYRVINSEYLKSLGAGGAFFLDMKGELPKSLAQAQPALAGKKVLPRVAFLNTVSDAVLLDKSWKSLLDLANSILVFLPPPALPPGGKLPAAQSREANGVKQFFYPLPMETGDLTPNLARTGDGLMILSSSLSLPVEIAGRKGAGSPPPGGFEFGMRFGPVVDYGLLWIDIASSNPDAMFAKDDKKKAEFEKDKPSVIKLLNSMRALKGMRASLREENGIPRATSVIEFGDL